MSERANMIFDYETKRYITYVPSHVLTRLWENISEVVQNPKKYEKELRALPRMIKEKHIIKQMFLPTSHADTGGPARSR